MWFPIRIFISEWWQNYYDVTTKCEIVILSTKRIRFVAWSSKSWTVLLFWNMGPCLNSCCDLWMIISEWYFRECKILVPVKCEMFSRFILTYLHLVFLYKNAHWKPFNTVSSVLRSHFIWFCFVHKYLLNIVS